MTRTRYPRMSPRALAKALFVLVLALVAFGRVARPLSRGFVFNRGAQFLAVLWQGAGAGITPNLVSHESRPPGAP